ncbi:MAG TPA: alternative ribosome rescue aminoacyl-tRNA hydrolase ArfB [Phycisphaerales bacterium]|nr:alternative ribosome rescue aminoacyl-tRNA hydrolase ArfB [Phycisphaerales bacterium]
MNEQRDQQGAGGVEIAPGVRLPPAALRFSYASSSGPGGQNVNKRATKAVLRVALDDLPVDARVRARLERFAKGWLAGDSDDGAAPELVIHADEHRSQRRNREACLERLRELLVRAMARPKPRVATRPGRGAVERRLRAKREQAEKKGRRRRDGPAD